MIKVKVSNVLVIGNRHKQDCERLEKDIRAKLNNLDIKVDIFGFSGKPTESPDLCNKDLIITLGGDGTVLYASRLAAPCDIPILPVNLGSLGFIAWIKKNDWFTAFKAVVEDKLVISRRMMIDVQVVRESKRIHSYSALNDAVVSSAMLARIVNLSINISGSSLGTYKADGVIVATPTGSTAYSLAAGGPILDVDMEAMVFNPICPFTLSNRPLVVPGGENIELYVEMEQREKLILTIDGQEYLDLLEGDRIFIKKAQHNAHIFCSARGAFYQVLRSKLNWSGGPDA